MALNTSLILVIISTINVSDIVVHHENNKKKISFKLWLKKRQSRGQFVPTTLGLLTAIEWQENKTNQGISWVCVLATENVHILLN